MPFTELARDLAREAIPHSAGIAQELVSLEYRVYCSCQHTPVFITDSLTRAEAIARFHEYTPYTRNFGDVDGGIHA